MSLTITCPKCQSPLTCEPAAVEQSVLCPRCGAGFAIGPAAPGVAAPLQAAAPGEVRPPGAAPGAMPPSWPDPRGMLHIKLIGIFFIVCGALSLLWTCLAGFYTALFPMMASGRWPGAAGTPTAFPTDFPLEIITVVCAAMTVLSLATAGVQFWAGYAVLKRRRGARKWGYAAAAVSVVALWTYCLWPLLLAAGVYSLIALSLEHVRQTLAHGRQD
jgi:hypothetical protein